LRGPPPDRFYDVDSDDESAIFESPFHRPPVPERNFPIPPPGSPPVGWEQTCEESPNEVLLTGDLPRAFEQLRVQREHAREACLGTCPRMRTASHWFPRAKRASVCVFRIGVTVVVSLLAVALKGGMRSMRS